MKLKRYFPGCVDTHLRGQTDEFDNEEELFDIPWVHAKRKQKGFKRLILDGRYLMLEHEDDEEPWVIGIIEADK